MEEKIKCLIQESARNKKIALKAIMNELKNIKEQAEAALMKIEKEGDPGDASEWIETHANHLMRAQAKLDAAKCELEMFAWILEN